MRKKFFIVFLCLICLTAAGFELFVHKNVFYGVDTPKIQEKDTIDEKLKKAISFDNSDKDGDGIKDQEDILLGARKEAYKRVKYKSAYYTGGYPPESEGVCTDLVWRAFRDAGYNLKDMVDEDIRDNPGNYAGVHGKIDPNIDFRRVSVLYIYFKNHAASITTQLKPNDFENLKQWQPGDILTFDNSEHIAVVSDKRRADGVPYIIHSSPPYARESDEIMYWMPKITGHFRFSK